MRTVGVVSTNRADFGLYLPILHALRERGVSVRVLASAGHLSPRQGLTIDEVRTSGFEVEALHTAMDGDDAAAVAGTMAMSTLAHSRSLMAHPIDLALVLGDRTEMLGAVAALLAHHVPIAHVHGGEVTLGAIDEACRHAITKMAHLHFCATEGYGRRIAQMGEEGWRIHVTGAPGLDNALTVEPFSDVEMSERFGVDVGDEPFLVTFHPVTMELEHTDAHVAAMLGGLDDVRHPTIITYPNPDAHGRRIIDAIEAFSSARPWVTIVKSFGMQGYMSILRHARAVVGNSSSGIIEAASFGLPVVNIGSRQDGRTRGENVLDVPPERTAIAKALRGCGDPAFRKRIATMKNPYGDGAAGPRIAEVLATVALDGRLTRKVFVDLEASCL